MPLVTLYRKIRCWVVKAKKFIFSVEAQSEIAAASKPETEINKASD